MMNKAMEAAKKNLERDGILFALAFLFKGDELLYVLSADSVPYEADDDASIRKRKHMFGAGSLAYAFQADRVITVYDAALTRMTKPMDDYDPSKDAPLMQPRSQRTECIIVTSITLGDGTSEIDALIQKYKGGEGEPVEWLGSAERMEGFQNNLIEYVRKGWEKIKEMQDKACGRSS